MYHAVRKSFIKASARNPMLPSMLRDTAATLLACGLFAVALINTPASFWN